MLKFSSRASRFIALFPALIGFVLCGAVQAETLSTLMYFDGASPQGGLVADGSNRLFGAVGAGGSRGGVLYRLEADTSKPNPILSIYQFGRLDVWNGALPVAGLLLGSDGMLYGTTARTAVSSLTGVASGTGTIFRVSVDGQNYTKLFEFDPLTVDSRNYLVNASGAYPQATLVEGLEGGVTYLYGVASQGGPDGTGVVFKIPAHGTGTDLPVVLASFAAATLKSGSTDFDTNTDGRLKNPNGVNPNQRLQLGGDNYVYGTTTYGGSNGTGVVFRVPIAVGAIEVLHEFGAIVLGDATATPPTRNTNTDGAYPFAGLKLDGTTLYGTTSSLGTSGYGTVFSLVDISTDTTTVPHVPIYDFRTIHYFGLTDGASPSGNFIIDSGMLVGTTQTGGTVTTSGVASGTVYKLPLNALVTTPLIQLCVFDSTTSGTNGAGPVNGVIQIGTDSFVGVAASGGYGFGLIYECASTATSGPIIGTRPNSNSGGAIPGWMIAMLATLLAVQLVRRARRSN